MKSAFSIIGELNNQVIVLALGRLASAIGTGLTIFYAPIFFVNVAGISATNVGIGIGLGGAFGVLGRFLGGTCADSPKVGRKGSLLIASTFLAFGAAFFAFTEVFWQFVAGNILTGLGIGFYWPAAESFISDVTEKDKLNEAFALTRLADYIGLGLGVIAGGLVIGFHSAYRILFIADSLSYMVLFLFVLVGIKETLVERDQKNKNIWGNWISAFKDRKLVLYALLNLLFTNNILQMSSTLPLYFSNFVSFDKSLFGGNAHISIIFSIYIVMVSLLVMPLARITATVNKTKVLIVACLFWTLAHSTIAILGFGLSYALALAVGIIFAFAVGNALYGPSASSLVVEIAPQDSRATYLSVNSLCWGISGSFGPAIGLAALDQGTDIAVIYWFALALVNIAGVIGLLALKNMIAKSALH